MDYKLLYGFKSIFLLICSLVWLNACSPSAETLSESNFPESVNSSNNNNNGNSGNSSGQSSSDTSSGTNTSGSQGITITYQNQSSNVEVKLDPDQEQFVLDLTGMKPAEKDTVVIADSTLIKNRAKDIQKLLSAFREAQDLFYLGEYNEALLKVNESIRIQETADAYGLKGTIYFMLDNKSATRTNWNKAVQLNPDIRIPSIPELEEIIEDIKGDAEQ